MTGIIYLIPVTLGDDNYKRVIPDEVVQLTCSLRYFIVEEIKSARRYLRMIDKGFPIDDSRFFELNEHTRDHELGDYLKPAIQGDNVGLMSEAGMPGIADPGSKIVAMAHRKNIRIVPLAGPSSIIMALIASGMNGQNFAFNGYLPVSPAELSVKLKDIEKRSQSGQTQIFIETPYRNQKLFETIISNCHSESLLSIASDITMTSESIKTMKIHEWARNKPDLNKRPTVFLLHSC